MTQDMIELAKKAGIPTGSRFVGGEVVECLTLEVEAFVKLVQAHTLANIDPSKFMSYQEGVAAEREACAKMVDKNLNTWVALVGKDKAYKWLSKLADAIRARGEA